MMTTKKRNVLQSGEAMRREEAHVSEAQLEGREDGVKQLRLLVPHGRRAAKADVMELQACGQQSAGGLWAQAEALQAQGHLA